MNKRYGFPALLGLILSVNTAVKVDVLDFTRPEAQREDYSKPSEPAGLLMERYTTKGGEEKVHLAPLESVGHMFGVGRAERQYTPDRDIRLDENE